MYFCFSCTLFKDLTTDEENDFDSYGVCHDINVTLICRFSGRWWSVGFSSHACQVWCGLSHLLDAAH